MSEFNKDEQSAAGNGVDDTGSPLDEQGAESRLAELEQELEIQTRKALENLELAQRTRADMENLRKRTTRDIENAHKYALERFLTELLPVLDSLELGIQASNTTADLSSVREGMQLTLKKFADSLEKAGVVAVDPQGQKFNPERHSAVSMVAVEGTEPGTVINVLQKGYELNGRLVRPAMVVVSSQAS